MHSIAPVLRRRKPRPGPELEMLASALESGLPIGFPGQPTILREPELPVGSPDVVAMFPRARKLQARAPLSPAHARVLHQMWLSGGVRVPDLARLLHISPRRLTTLVDELTELDLVWCRGTYCATRSLDRIFPVRQIVAVEAKMTDWKKGLDQAEANLWFASVSYLLLPHRRVLTAPIQAATNRGVGLLSYDDRSVRRLVRPRPVEIPRSYGSWLLSEWLIESSGCDQCWN
jgi:hypothetical protein